jgi:hypothetical protein
VNIGNQNSTKQIRRVFVRFLTHYMVLFMMNDAITVVFFALLQIFVVHNLKG